LDIEAVLQPPSSKMEIAAKEVAPTLST